MPRRAIAAAAATAGGLALLLSFKTPARGSRPTAAAGGAGQTPTTSGSSSASGSGKYRDGTDTGSDVQTQFGDLQVKVTISGGRITDVTELTAPYDRPRSQDINSYAAPILHDEAVAAQSASIDTVSGATISSDAYTQSLQAALDQASK